MANSPVHVAMIPALLRKDGLERSLVIAVDLLRATTTIAHAIAAGASAVRLVAEPADAIRERDGLGAAAAVAAGERGGVAPAGFDLGNSPRDFTRASVGGKTVVFTTTNGTKVIGVVKSAATVITGALVNRRAAAERAVRHDGPVMIACAGTDGRVAMEDCIAAGAIIDAMLAIGGERELTDPAQVCLWAWRGASTNTETVGAAVHAAQGARNLQNVGLGRDVADCLRVDTIDATPLWNGEAIVGS